MNEVFHIFSENKSLDLFIATPSSSASLEYIKNELKEQMMMNHEDKSAAITEDNDDFAVSEQLPKYGNKFRFRERRTYKLPKSNPISNSVLEIQATAFGLDKHLGGIQPLSDDNLQKNKNLLPSIKINNRKERMKSIERISADDIKLPSLLASGAVETTINDQNSITEISPTKIRRHKLPLYLRMIANAQRNYEMEQKFKFNEYKKVKQLRSKRTTKEEILIHIAKHDDFMKNRNKTIIPNYSKENNAKYIKKDDDNNNNNKNKESKSPADFSSHTPPIIDNIEIKSGGVNRNSKRKNVYSTSNSNHNDKSSTVVVEPPPPPIVKTEIQNQATFKMEDLLKSPTKPISTSHLFSYSSHLSPNKDRKNTEIKKNLKSKKDKNSNNINSLDDKVDEFDTAMRPSSAALKLIPNNMNAISLATYVASDWLGRCLSEDD